MGKIKALLAIFLIALMAGGSAWAAEKKYKTENVVILVMDGPRHTETWGDPTHQYIPHLANDIIPQGAFYPNFRNEGPTYTAAGHTAMTTGVYQRIDNTGLQFPKHPSIFQYWLKKSEKKRNAAYVISSKDKLVILTDCRKRSWKGQYRPYSDCGVNGLYTGYRSDRTTYQRSLQILEKDKPNLVLINFRQPDSWGHAGNWEKYLSSMKKTDQYIHGIFKFIQTNEHYKGKTTVFITNDHGRHLDGRKDGFISHGDNCEGCRRIICFAYGPDFVSGKMFDEKRELIDIPVTVAELLGFQIEKSKGEVMKELFIQNN
ncbi:MAG: alkaline phosphatase family protein [Flavobacteriales bacterium]|nr:alkaline phosphatase family protein [Flavobacteriales bacterium]